MHHSFNNLGLIDSDSAAVITFLSVLSLLFYIHRAITVRYFQLTDHTLYIHPQHSIYPNNPINLGRRSVLIPSGHPGKSPLNYSQDKHTKVGRPYYAVYFRY